MRIIALDYETFFSDDYTLKKLTTENYVRDPRFQAHGAAVKWGPDHAARWYDDRELRHILAQEDWSDTAIICHHAHFDGLILSHHYDIRPRFWFDTLGMARLLLGNHISVSLDSVRKQFNLPAKRTPYEVFKGKHWHELTASEQELIADGCCDEVESIWTLFGLLAKEFPKSEYELVDMTVRMFTEPTLRGDIDLLAKIWSDENKRKVDLLRQMGIADPGELQSNDKFAALLRAEGIDPALKQGKNGPIYAFAKTDDFMQELLNHDSPRVSELARARLGIKSTAIQTRAETLGFMASRGSIPVYLRYCGAATTRWSGGDGGNFQNFKRGHKLRKTILAPPGFDLAIIDSSQIECRVLNFLAGQWDVVERFRKGEDPYIKLASEFYGRPITKADTAERGAGKQGELMCLGADTKILTLRGPITITAVKANDWLWDGIEWVRHCGVVSKGERYVINVAGLNVTPDHLVLCENFWVEASALQNENILSRSLATVLANCPLQVMKLLREADLDTLWFNALVEHLNIQSIRIIFLQGVQHAVINALKKLLVIGQKNITAMQLFVLTIIIGVDYLGEFQRFSFVANLTATKTMVEEELEFHGNSGHEKNFWPIWLRSLDGIIRYWKLIELKTIKAIKKVILDLQQKRKIIRTKEQSNSYNKKMIVYDILLSGPRNRFTVVTNAGPLIVHNCGYGCAGRRFSAVARLELYGPAIDIDEAEGNRRVTIYRDTHRAVTAYWGAGEEILGYLANGQTVAWDPFTIRDHKIYLPTGLRMNYDTLEWYAGGDLSDEAHSREVGWRLKTRQGWTRIWGSKLVQNVCEMVARAIVGEAMVRIKQQGLRIVGMSHDEIWVLIPKSGEPIEVDLEQQTKFQFCLDTMRTAPAWLSDIPLDAEGTMGERYAK